MLGWVHVHVRYWHVSRLAPRSPETIRLDAPYLGAFELSSTETSNPFLLKKKKRKKKKGLEGRQKNQLVCHRDMVPVGDVMKLEHLRSFC